MDPLKIFDKVFGTKLSSQVQSAKDRVNSVTKNMYIKGPGFSIGSPPPVNAMARPMASPSVSPTSTPTPLPPVADIPKLNETALMMLQSPIATESSKKYIENILNAYKPKTPDIPVGWKSPLLNQTQAMAEATYANKLHPALPVLMAIAETQAMRPLASGTKKLNPYNIMNPGTQDLYDYNVNGGLQRAVTRWPQNIASNWTNANITEWRKNPTLRDFVYAYNPTDNPKGELDTIMQLVKQLGL